ncbi:class I SAM-dependent methyltransferase [Pseudonocardiaceae bacterium YIM PH 21723]|nr:class I SAM-dependent methyltransferase [Pseudonocardiaceae bacterium YIM PH 21723]
MVPSPNIWHWPQIYEIENRAQDVHGALWAALHDRYDYRGCEVLDVGCGAGFHLPVLARDATSVIGVEPHPPLVKMAAARIRDLHGVSVLAGTAQNLPLADSSVDLVHARTAYFFGPGCEPGILEALRVLRPGGVLAVIDLDITATPYGAWMRADLPDYKPTAVAAFFAEHDFTTEPVDTLWRFSNRDHLEQVLGIEFSPATAAKAIAQVSGLEFPVRYLLRTLRKPEGLILPG